MSFYFTEISAIFREKNKVYCTEDYQKIITSYYLIFSVIYQFFRWIIGRVRWFGGGVHAGPSETRLLWIHDFWSGTSWSEWLFALPAPCSQVPTLWCGEQSPASDLQEVHIWHIGMYKLWHHICRNSNVETCPVAGRRTATIQEKHHNCCSPTKPTNETYQSWNGNAFWQTSSSRDLFKREKS